MIIHKNVLNSFLVNNCRLGRVDINPPSLIFNNNNMALQVWLPLNKSGADKNQGLGDSTITNFGAVYESSGKLGGCYKCTKSAGIHIESKPWMKMVPGNSFSVSMWIKGCSGNTWAIACTSWELNFRTSILSVYPGGTISNGGCAIYQTFDNDTWYHIAFSYNGDTPKLSLYLNGEFKQEYVTTYTREGITSTIILPYGDTRYINDFRIYDHCLSPKEVKEISKGLVLHYPLNSLVNPNLVKNSYFCTNMNNGTVEVVPNVGYVDNTAYYGSPAYHVFREGQTTIAYSEFQFIFRANKCVPGKQYCISFWVKKCHSGGNWGNIILDGLRWFKTGDNTMYTTSITWNNRPSESLLNVWQYASFYFTFPVECTAYAYYYNTVGKDIDYYISKIKVEEGTVSTPWCDYGITNNIVYDCSGYQNNGTISGSLSCSANSPRYKISTISIDESSFSKILCSNLNLPNGQTTLSFWSKPTNKNEKDSSKIEITYSKNKYFTYINYPYFIHDGDYKYKWKNYWSDGNWHFVTCLFDGTNTKIYIDSNNISPNTDSNTSTAKTQLDNLTLLIKGYSLSDFRVYATALSEEDIKELYNTSCIINS